MGEYTTDLAPIPATSSLAGPTSRPRRRGRIALPALSFAAAASFVLVTVVDPTSGAVALQQHQASVAELSARNAQSVTLDATLATAAVALAPRENFSVIAPPPPPPPPPAPVAVEAPKQAAKAAAKSSPSSSGGGGAAAPSAAAPSPGSAQAVAHEMVLARGWGEDQYSCLVSLWKKESGWRTNAANPSSGAYGIPQALPGSKMASAGADWATNPATQIAWGLGYITSRYDTPCGAWGSSQSRGWY
jgi:hypothetical protein